MEVVPTGDTAPVVVEEGVDLPACSDGEDNDGDDKVDYPADPGCTNGEDDNEKDADPTKNTCAYPGLFDPTLAESLFGPGLNENGPISGALHDLESPGLVGSVIHEGACVVAVLDGD